MRPHDPAVRRQRASGLASARLLIKSRLGWLSGFPGTEGWWVVPDDGRPPERLVLSRDHVRRATLASRKLCGEFPRALPKIVGDVEAWEAGVTCCLEALKPWVHGAAAPPSSLFGGELYPRPLRGRACALAQKHPVLADLVDASSWVYATRPGAAERAVSWVEREAEVLADVVRSGGPVAIGNGIGLIHVALAVGARATAPLVRLVAVAARGAVPTIGGTAFIDAALAGLDGRGSIPVAAPQAEGPGGLIAAARALLTEDPGVARRWLALLDASELAPLFEDWAAWWLPVVRLATRGRGVLHHGSAGRSPREHVIEGLRRQLQGRRDGVPAAVELAGFLADLRTLAGADFRPAYASARHILGRLGGCERAALRLAFVKEWSELHGSTGCWWKPRRLPALLRTLDAYIAAGPTSVARLGLWVPSAQRRGPSRGVGRDLLDTDPPSVITTYCAALRWLEDNAPDVPLAEIRYTLLRQIEAVPEDVAVSARLVAELHRAGHHGHWISKPILRTAWRIAAPVESDYVPVLRALERTAEETELDAEALEEAMIPAPDGCPLPLVRALLEGPERGAFVRTARKLALLRALGTPVSLASATSGVTARATTEAGSLGWIDRYPAAFRGELRELASWTAQAERLASRILGSIAPDPRELRAERAAIEAQMLDAARERRAVLERRLETLQRRLTSPPAEPSPVRVERLRAKLHQRSALARLESWEAVADARLPEALRDELGVDPLPSWALEDRVLSLLGHLRRLPAETRRLARSLFAARAGTSPWDLREYPQNAAFLDRLRNQGIEPTPWVDGIGSLAWRTGRHAMTLSLESDPLEIFHMGRHFGTCLSPGHCNFFSVFANAADINKRVLYARDGRGTVVGRRLLCLTDAGMLLAFHAYCHDARAGFHEASAEYARRLARALGTGIVGRGAVSRLVATRWYDDGPEDITGQFSALEEGSELRATLSEVSPSDLASVLARAFGPGGLDEAVAPLVLALPEVRVRPELSLELLRAIRQPDRLPIEALEVLGRQLHAAGAIEAAQAALTEPILAALARQHRDRGAMAPASLELLASLDARRALDLLRRTRERGVRRWEEERAVERLLAAGAALERMCRPAQAVRAYRAALDVPEASAEERRHVAARIEALTTPRP